MEYQTFLDEVVRLLQKKMDDDTQIYLQPMTKNNAVVMDGLALHKRGCQATPLIYMEQYYKMYLSGVSLDDIAERIEAVYREERPEICLDPEALCDWKKTGPFIVPRLVNREMNRKQLAEMPHRTFLDLALVYACEVSPIGGANASFRVRNDHCSHWGVDEPALYEAAVRNMDERMPPVLQSMEEMMRDLLHATVCEEYKPDPALYVLSNTQRSYGAAWIIREDVLAKAAEIFGSDFYVLPSSVHECILLPCTADMGEMFLQNMVREINETQVAPEEVLGDSIYRYCVNTGALQIAARPS